MVLRYGDSNYQIFLLEITDALLDSPTLKPANTSHSSKHSTTQKRFGPANDAGLAEKYFGKTPSEIKVQERQFGDAPSECFTLLYTIAQVTSPQH